MKRSVVIHRETVVKTGDVSKMAVEAEKTRRAYALANESQLFRVPRVLDFDGANGTIVLERIPDLVSMGDVLNSPSQNLQFLAALAKAMACIHAEFALPDEMKIELPEPYRFDPRTNVFLHGDLSIKNIFMSASDSKVVILDWQMTEVHGGKSTYGTRYFDVSWVVNNLFFFLCNPRAAFSREITAEVAVNHFVENYLHIAKLDDNHDQFQSYLRQFFDFKLSHRFARLNLLEKVILFNAFRRIRKFISSFDSSC
ncbi:MAG: hypothetical protein WBD31_24225 [Rubripirellula sp.]